MITCTSDMFAAITNAQLEHTRDMITACLPPNRMYDDAADYLSAALSLSDYLISLNGDVDMFNVFINSADIANYACDGICQAIYDLKPAALEE